MNAMVQRAMNRVLLCGIALCAFLATPCIGQSSYTVTETDDGFLEWKNPVAWARIGIEEAGGIDGDIQFGSLNGDPTRADDNNITYINAARSYLFVQGYGNMNEMEIGADGQMVTLPQVDDRNGSASYLWETTEEQYKLNVEFRMWLVRDVLKWQYVITNNTPQSLRTGFRVIFDVNFAGEPAGPYYLPGSPLMDTTQEYLGADVPSEWFIRHSPLGSQSSNPLLRFRMPLQGDVTRPSRVAFGRTDPDLDGYSWPEILEAELPENQNEPPLLPIGQKYGDSFGVGLYFPIQSLAYREKRVVKGEFRLDWSKVNTLMNQYALGVTAPEWLTYLAGDDATTTTIQESGYYDPAVFDVTGYVFNASSNTAPMGSVTINLGKGLVLDPELQAQQSKTITGIGTDHRFVWRVRADGSASGMIPVQVTSSLYPGGSITTTNYVNVPALPQVSTLRLKRTSHFIGVPFDLMPSDAMTVFDQVLNAIGSGFEVAWYDPALGDYRYARAGSSTDQLSLERGKGYWIKIPDTAPSQQYAIPLNGATAFDQTAPYAMPLEAGWNAISNPFQFSILYGYCKVTYRKDTYTYETLTLLEAINKGLIRRELWAWNADDLEYYPPINPYPYQNMYGELKPGEGYWLYATQPCTMVFIPHPFVGPMGGRTAKTRVAGQLNQWQVNLVVETSKGKDSSNVIGVSPTDQDGLSEGDVMEPPVGPTGLTAYFPRRNWGRMSANYASDMQAPGTVKSWTMEVACARPNERVVLRWPDLTQLPPRMPLMLTDTLTGQRVSMRTAPHYTYNSGAGGVRRFTITAGGTIERLLFTSTQVMRSRSAAGATIACGLTVPAQVTVRIRNTSGRLVRTLGPTAVNGQGTIVWDGCDDRGRALPVGMYLGEMYAEAQDGQRMRAMVMINTRY